MMGVQYECEDVLRDSNLFEAVGVGIGKQEMYNVMLMVKKLGEDPKKGVATIRYFGKFLGLSADYFVFETTLKEAPEEPEEVLGEHIIGDPPGTLAINEHVLCNHSAYCSNLSVRKSCSYFWMYQTYKYCCSSDC